MLTNPSWVRETQTLEKHLPISVWAVIEKVRQHRQEVVKPYIIERLVFALHETEDLLTDLTTIPFLQELFVGRLLEACVLDTDVTFTHSSEEIL
jgi:hypothetical protein